MKKLNVMSLFNGMSFGMMALETLGVEVGNYYSSEIDKYANQATQALYPDVIQMGDVTKWREWDVDWSSIDLLLAGFPCQAWSIAGKQEGDNDPRGALVHDLIDIWNHIKSLNPDMKFMFENVKMKKKHFDYINELFGVEPICINSTLVSAQNRVRYYWTNIPGVEQPEDKGILLSSILEDLPDCNVGIKVREKSKCVRCGGRNSPFGSKHEWDSPYQRISKKGVVKPNMHKAACLTGGANSGGNHSDMDIIHTESVTRRYSVTECALLQTVPPLKIPTLINCGVSNSQLYKMIANGWTHDVIVHIFKGLTGQSS